MVIKDKKGMLLASEMVKIIIAVIAIGFLVYFLTLLYFSKVEGENGRKATEILIGSGTASVKNLILSIEDHTNNITERSRALGTPEGWYLFSFVGNQKKPNSCAREHCLCICDNVVDYFDRQIKSCDDIGVCLIIENLDPKTDLELEISAKNPLTYILIREENGIIKVEDRS